MPSSFSNILADYFYGVVGLLRKRAQHRCEKRGQSFDQYKKSVQAKQRAIGKPLFEEQMKFELQKPNLFSLIPKDESWKGGSVMVPMFCEWAKRKRSQYRGKK